MNTIRKDCQQEKETMKKKLERISDLLSGHTCDNPETCWMNTDFGGGDIYGCGPNDESTITDCPLKIATCIMNIIEEKDE